MTLKKFIDKNYKHFNAAVVREAGVRDHHCVYIVAPQCRSVEPRRGVVVTGGLCGKICRCTSVGVLSHLFLLKRSDHDPNWLH